MCTQLDTFERASGWRDTLMQYGRLGFTVWLIVVLVLSTLLLPLVASATPLISGVKFNDLNGNGVKDPGEKGFPYEIIIFRGTSASPSVATDSNGQYSIDLGVGGEYTVMTGIPLDMPWDSARTAPVGSDEMTGDITLDLSADTTLNFGIWDGIARETPELVVELANMTTDLGNPAVVNGAITDPNSVCAYETNFELVDGDRASKAISCQSPTTGLKRGLREGNTSGTTTPIAASNMPLQAGTFDVSVTANDASGNTATDTAKAIVRDVAKSDPCDKGIPTVFSVKSGDWNDPSIWSPAGVPSSTAWVMISSGTKVTLPVITDPAKSSVKVTGLCVASNSTLVSASNVLGSSPTWVAINTATLHNQGSILGAPGINGSGPMYNAAAFQHATAGSSIFIRAPRTVNDGTILAGTGGYDPTYMYMNDACCQGVLTKGGAGGMVELYPGSITNNGTVQAGNGGAAIRVILPKYVHGPSQGGEGGLVRVMATNPDNAVNTGKVIGGRGGDNYGAGGTPGKGGAAEVNFGKNSGTITPGGAGSYYAGDPITLRFDSNTRIGDTDDITLFAGKDGQLLLNNLVENAISANKTLTLAVGTGGTIDFRGSAPKSLSAPTVRIHADNILLDTGVSLATLVETSNLVVGPAKVLGKVSWSGVQYVMDEVGVATPLNMALLNQGPEEDTYTISTAGSTCQVGALPKEAAVNSMRRNEIEFDVAVPTTAGEKCTVVLTATSHYDAEIQAVATVEVTAQEAEVISPRTSTADVTVIVNQSGNTSGEIVMISHALESFLGKQTKQNDRTLELITFDSGEVISRVTTQDIGDAITRIRKLKHVENYSCSGVSVAALESAVANINPNGQIILVTATPPEKDAQQVMAQLKDKGVQVRVILAGNCANNSKEIYQGAVEEVVELATQEALEQVVSTAMTVNSSGGTNLDPDNSVSVVGSDYTLTISFKAGATVEAVDMPITFAAQADGSYFGENAGISVVIKPHDSPVGSEDNFTITTGKNLSENGETTTFTVTAHLDGSYTMTGENGDVVTVGADGIATLIVANSAGMITTFNADGSMSVMDETSPEMVTTFHTDGSTQTTHSAFLGLVMNLSAEGKAIVKDTANPDLTVTVNSDGTYTVTDAAFPDMTATLKADGSYQVRDTATNDEANVTVNADGTFTVVDVKDPSLLVTVDKDGKVLGCDSNLRGFWKTVTSFVSRAAGFVAKVAAPVVRVANFVNTVAGGINKVANWVIQKAPVINTWATRIQNWTLARNTGGFLGSIFGAVSKVAGWVANITTPGSKLLTFAGKVANFTSKVMNIAKPIATVAQAIVTGANKVKDFFSNLFNKLRSREVRKGSLREGTEPQECYVEDPSGNAKASGVVSDRFSNPLAGITIHVGDKTVVTNEQGYWEINDLAEGKHVVRVNQNGYATASQTVEVGEDQPANVTLKLSSLLKVQVGTQPRVAKQGENVTYTITVTNKGTLPATNVVINDILPVGTELVSIEAVDGSSCDGTHCTLAELAVNTSAKVKLVVRNSGTQKLKNEVSVSANEYPNDLAVTWTEVIPHLSVAINCTPNPVPIQGNLLCSMGIDLSAQAPTGATNTQFLFELPKGIELKSVTSSQGVCDTQNLPKISCALGDLNVGSHLAINVDTQLKEVGLLSFVQTAQVQADNYPVHSVKERTDIQIPPGIEVDMALVIDDTGSMQQEIDGAKEALRQFIADIDSNQSPLIALVTFKDEAVVRFFGRDLNLLLKEIGNLKASGGGMCPEASVEALNAAIPHIKQGGSILFVTDASPYDDADLEKLAELLQNKAIRLNSIVTGDCSDQNSWNSLEESQ